MKLKTINYRYDISIESEKKEYDKMVLTLKNNKPFHVSGFQHNRDRVLTKKNMFHILDTSYIFDNQYNTRDTNLRIFEWSEIQFPNKDIKEGYYIQPKYIKNIRDLQEKIYKCEYCGKQTENPNDSGYCNLCRGSEYLKPENYHLLELKKISDTSQRIKKVPCNIIESIKENQHITSIFLKEKAIARAIESKRKDISKQQEKIDLLKKELNNMKYDNQNK